MSNPLLAPHELRVPAHEYHRRRAENEMEKALSARQPSVSIRHLELARIHRQRREELVAEEVAHRPAGPVRICGTDKEG